LQHNRKHTPAQQQTSGIEMDHTLAGETPPHHHHGTGRKDGKDK